MFTSTHNNLFINGLKWLMTICALLLGLTAVSAQVDVSLTSWANKVVVTEGESFTVRVVAHNDLATAMTGLQVMVTPPAGISQTGVSAPAGTNFSAGLWNIGSAMNANVDSLVLTITYTADTEGPHVVVSEVYALMELDIDSAPNDGAIKQDDYATAYVTVPIRFCAATGDAITLEAPVGLTDYQWYRDEGLGALPITGATNRTYDANLSGTYTYVAIDPVSYCPATGCCPIILNEQCMDLALFKQLANGQAEMVEPGDIVTFTITVINQGTMIANNIVLSDYIPAQMSFVAQAGWSAAGGIATRTLQANDELPAGGLLPGESVSVDIQLRVNNPLAVNTVITNWAEISSATDENGDIQPDVDSNPDNMNTDLFLVDNDIDGDGKLGGDEDDHDPASVIVEPFDLALFKQLANGQPEMVEPGDDVTFTITVVNQGMIAADNIDLADYFDPTQLALNDAAWVADGAGRISLVNELGPLAPGASASVNVTFTLASPLASNTIIYNWAEISAATDDAGNLQDDLDSNPDNTNNDLFLVDDEITGDGKNGGDEDDHDRARLIVKPFDLALYKTLAIGQPEMVEAGDKVTFTIHVTNQGMIAAGNIQLVDYIPANMTFVPGDNPAWNPDATTTLPGTLAPGATTSLDIVLTVNSPLAANTVITNFAEIKAATDDLGNPQVDIDSDPDMTPGDLYLVDNEINGDGKNGGDEDDHDAASVTVEPFDLALYKQLANGQSSQVKPGDKVTYTLTVVNQGLVAAGNIQLVDYVPAGMSFVLADNAGWSAAGPNYVTTLPGTLAPGASTSVNVVLTVNNPLPANTTLINWAEIASATDDQGNPQVDIDSDPDQTNDDLFLVDDEITGDGKNGGDEDDHDRAVVVVEPFDMALYKKLANGQDAMVEPGDNVTFTITVVNQGAITATNIEVTDYIPAGFTFQAGSNDPGWSLSGSKATRTIAGPVAPNASTSIDIVLRVNDALPSGTVLTNWAEISDAQDLNGESQLDIDSNPDDANNDLFLADNDINGNGKADGDEDDHDPASVTVEPFDLALTKQLAVGQSATVEPGDDVTFTITVYNQGMIDAGNIDIADYFDPSQLTLNDANWTADGVGRVSLINELGPLATGESVSMNITFTVASPLASNTVITNWAEISSATDESGNAQVDVDSDPDNANNDNFLLDNDINGNGKNGGDEDDHDPASVTVEPFDLALYKQLAIGQPYQVEPGDDVTFTITVVNQGDITADNIVIADYFNPAHLVLNDANWSSISAGRVSLDNPLGPLVKGGSTSVDITFTVVAPLASNTVITNWAEIASATDDADNPQVDIDSNPDVFNDDLFLVDDDINGDGKNGGDEDDHDKAELIVKPFDLALVKQLAAGQAYEVEPGDVVTFTITVTNQGMIAADNIQLADYFPSQFSLVAQPGWTTVGNLASRTLNSGDELPAGGLLPGASVPVNIQFLLASPLPSNLLITNWAEIAGATDDANNPHVDVDSNPDAVNQDKFLVDDDIDGNGKNGGDEDDHDKAVVITKTFDLALDKVLSAGQSAAVEPGDKVSFDIRVYNQGMIAANNVEITDYVPAGMSFVAADNPGWSFATGKAKTTITTVIPPAGTATRTLVLTVNNPLAAGTSLQNWAEISAATDDANNPQVDVDSNPDDANDDTYNQDNEIAGNGKAGEDEDDHDQETVVVKRFDLALIKVLDPGQDPEVIPGMNVDFDIIVYNQGEYDAYNIELTDYLPANLIFNAADNPGWSLAGGKPTYTIPGPIAPGASVNVPLVLMADAPILGNTEVINTAEISDAQDNDGISQIDDDSTPDTDDQDTYLQDNEIFGDGKAGEDEDDHDKAMIIVKTFDLALYKQLAPFEDMFAEPGEEVTYVITVVNQGMIPADNIEVTDYIPAGMTLMDDPLIWASAGNLATRTLSVANGDLPVGGLQPADDVTVSITLKVPDPIAENTKLVNWAEISDFSDADGFPMVDIDSDPDQNQMNDKFLIDDYIGGDAKNKGDDEDDHDKAYVMYRVYDLALRKTVDNDCPVRPGDTIEYTITVFNQGTEPVQDIVLVDSISAGLLFDQGIQLFGWHLDGTPNRVTFEIDDPIQPLDSAKVKLFYIIKPGCLYYNDLWNFAEIAHFDNLFGALKDTADIDSKPDKFFWNDNVVNDIIDDDGTLDEDDHDIQIPPIFDLAVRQIELVNLPVKIGQDVPYEITVFNQGNITAYDIQLKEFLPYGFILSPDDADGWTDIGNLMATVTVPGPLEPGDSVKLQVLLRVTEDAHEGDLMNYVEIQGAVDENGKDMTPFDFDSDPDMDPLNDLLTNDVIDKCKQIEEDDNDKSTVELFDLALRKTPYERQRVQWGDDVTFTITVFNQSPLLSAENIDLVDYLPTGFSLSPNDANGWVNSIAGHITNNIPGPIAPGDSVKVDVTLRVDIGAPGGDTDNFAEITSAFDTDGRDLTNYDFDSQPDNDNSNDVVVDNEIDEHDQGIQDEDDHDLAPIFVEIFDLALRKTTEQEDPVLYGHDVTFTITVFNQGNVPATDVELRDYLPSGFKMKFANLGGWTMNASTLAYYKINGPIAPGDSAKVDIILTVQEEASPFGLTNAAEIIKAKNELGQDRTGDDIDSWNDSNPNNDLVDDDVIDEQAKLNPGDEEDDHDIATVYMVDLALRKTTPVKKPVTVGDDVLFTIEVFNQGTVTVQDVSVMDHIPAGFILSPVETDWVLNGNGTISGVISGPLASLESDTIDLILRVAPDAKAGFFTNFAEITRFEDENGINRTDYDVDSTPDEDPNNDAYVDDEINDAGDFDEDDHDGATVEVEIIDLALRKITQFPNMQPVKIGQDITFAIEVFNQGSVWMYDIDIVDYIPAGFMLSPTDANNWTVVGTNAYNTIAGPIAPGGKRSIGIVLRVTGAANVDNLVNGAEIIGAKDPNGEQRADDDRDSQPDQDPNNDDLVDDEVLQKPPVDEDDHDVEGVPVFDLALRKQPAFTGKVTVGDDIDFTITVFNQGNITATQVGLVDYIPEGTSLSPNDANGWANSGSTAQLFVPGPIEPGDSAKVTITLRVLPTATAGFHVNRTEIFSARDEKGVSMSDKDLDSTPDFNKTNDNEKDDVINENGLPGNDEDDADLARFEIEIIDIALRKTLDPVNQVNPMSVGDDVIFEIEVFNQGSVLLQDITLMDHYPVGFGLSPNDNNGWFDNGDGTASLAFPYDLPVGQSATIGIVLVLEKKIQLGDLPNTAEVTSMKDANGDDRSDDDRDSTPDTDKDNDNLVDDEIFSGGDPDEDDHDVATVFVDGFDLALVKRVAADQTYPIKPGSPVHFQVTVFNQGTYDAFNVQVTDYVPNGLTITDAAWNQVGNQATLINPVFIAAGDSLVIDLNAQVNVGYMGFNLVNRAEISFGDDDNDPNNGTPEDIDSNPDTNPDNDTVGGDDVTDNSNGDEDDHDPSQIEVDQDFDLALYKILANGQKAVVLPGDTVRFTIFVINQGTLNAYDIQVKDYVPAELAFSTPLNTALQTSNPYNWASDQTYTIPGPLMPGDSTSIDILLIVDENTTLEKICNHAEIQAADNDTNPANTPLDDEDSVADNDPDNDIFGGDNITDNTANDEDDHDEACIYLNQMFDLALIKQTLVTEAKPGDNVLFNIMVTNQGSLPGYDVDIIDYIPNGFLFNQGDNPMWSDNGNGTVSTTIAGPVEVGTSQSVLITLKVDPFYLGTSLTNLAEITGAAKEPGGPDADDEDSFADDNPNNDVVGGNDVTNNDNFDQDDHDPETIDVLQIFDLALIKTTNVIEATAGDTVTYTITVFNQGTQMAFDVVINDYLDPGFLFDQTLNNGWTNQGNGLLTFHLDGPIAPNTSVDVTINLVLDPGLQGGTITNNAEIGDADNDDDPNTPSPDDVDSESDNDPNNDPFGGDDVTNNDNGDQDDSDPATIDVLPLPIFDLALIKTAPVVQADLGDTITFSIKVFNQGNVPAYNVEITDYIPDGFLFYFGMNTGWTDNGNGTASMIIDGPIQPQTFTESTIKLIVDPDFTGSGLDNIAEISAADNDQDDNNTPPVDVDSTPDQDPDNDVVGGDNVIDNSNGDEDDHDHSFITVVPCKLVLKDVPADVTLECDQIGTLTDPVYATYTGGCCEPIQVELDLVTIPSAQCPQSYVLVRTWTAYDDCGHAITQSQTVTVKDTKAPVFTMVPANVTIECDSQAPSPVIGIDVKASDNCDPSVSIVLQETFVPGPCLNSYSIQRIWKATDDCGNFSTAVQMVMVRDTKAPVFTALPPDLTLNCNDPIPAAPKAEATDNCDTKVDVTYSESVTGNSPCSTQPSVLRRWVATDNCGNTAEYVQKIYLLDTQAPVITFTHPDLVGLNNGDTVTYHCTNQVVFEIDDAAVVDNCDINPVIQFIDKLIFDDGCKKLLYCEWTATDNCGNQSKKGFYMLVGDLSAPVITGVPSDITISCDAQIPPKGSPTVTDDCDPAPKLSLQETTLPGACPQAYTLVRTWTAMDLCGNVTTKSQKITIVDTKSPTFVTNNSLLNGKKSGDVIQVNCNNEPVFVVGDMKATDSCDPNPLVSLSVQTINGNCLTDGYFKRVTYTWTAKDGCGNTAAFVIHVDVSDTQKPVFTYVPANVTIQCNDPEPNTQATASDVCDKDLTITVSSSISQQPCGYLIYRTWTATDDCGNKATATQVVTVTDNQAPVIVGVPADITAACDQLPVPPSNVKATDDCDPNPKLTYSEEVPQGGCQGTYTMIRKWTATDKCGNVSTKTQKVTVVDNEAPVFTFVPADATISCEQMVPGAGQADAEDNCGGNVTIVATDDTTPGSCTDSYFVIRTFTATDACGNTATAQQKITVQDKKAPVFVNVPANVTISCDDAINLPEPTVADNCDQDVTLSHTETSTPGQCDQEYILTVTWTATDNCGNTATAKQVIKVEDNTAPTITPTHPAIAGVPSGSILTFNCDEVPVMDAGDVDATDNCDNDPEVVFTEVAKSGDCATDGYYTQLTCTWTATDNCGNVSTYFVYIRIADTKKPVFTFVPSNQTIECGDPVPGGVATADDNCDNDVVVNVNESEKDLNCGYQIIRTFTATDDCGNTATAQQVITVTDTGAPVLVGVPADITVDLTAGQSVPAPANVTATDECDSDVTVTFTEMEDTKDCGYLLIRTWTATDDCGNTAQATQMISVDEGCPCEEPVLETIESVQPTCGQKDGSITILLDGSEADFDYTWLPNKGTPNAAGNSHTGLGAGIYTIIVSDPGSANCFLKLTVELEVDGTCTDTVYVNIPAADPYQLCIESVLDLVGDVASASLCGYDTDAIESVDLNDNNGCLTIDPVDDFTGQTTICVIHCDDEVPANCDTTYIVVKIDAVKPCDDILTNSAVNLTITQCSALAETCINIPFASIGDYTITVNGVAYSGSMTSCGNGQGTMLAFGEGIFDLVITEISTSCSDEAVISVVCEEGNELIAVDDTGKTIKNKSNTINVLKNDIIPNNDLGDMYILTQPEHGIVKIEPNLLIKYTPDNEYCGPDQFEYVICNEVGCDTALVVIDVQCQSIFVKNGFSPNNDGVNDNFTIEGIESFPNNELTVFNRWGNQIFSQKGYKNNWNGTWDGADLPDGTYFYILKDGEGRTYSGFVQINR